MIFLPGAPASLSRPPGRILRANASSRLPMAAVMAARRFDGYGRDYDAFGPWSNLRPRNSACGARVHPPLGFGARRFPRLP